MTYIAHIDNMFWEQDNYNEVPIGTDSLYNLIKGTLPVQNLNCVLEFEQCMIKWGYIQLHINLQADLCHSIHDSSIIYHRASKYEQRYTICAQDIRI